MAKRNQLDSIKSRLVSRGLSLAKVSLKAGSRAAGQALSDALSASRDPEKFNKYLYTQIELLTKELGQLKGSLMKVGQLLSTYGEHFLPAEANQMLKSLQFNSPPVAWNVIEKVLKQELGDERMAELEIDTEPTAAASLGQVHRAVIKSNGTTVAIKIQYPGVDKAIDNDLRFLKTIFTMSQLIPRGPRFDQIFTEVKTMLHQEVDYRNEKVFTEAFRERLLDDDRYLVAEVHDRYSTSKVITTTFLEGVSIDGPEVAALSQERRNRLGEAYLELYMRELFEFGQVQTDPHFGNYRVEIDQSGEKDRLILLDFGAVRSVEESFLKPYHWLVRGALHRRQDWIVHGGEGLNFLKPDDPEELVGKYIELCYMFNEPFAKPHWNVAPENLLDEQGRYDWGASDLPQRVARKGADIVVSFRLRTPPHEIVFLDRKLGGTFTFLSKLGCKMNGRPIVERWVDDPPILRS